MTEDIKHIIDDIYETQENIIRLFDKAKISKLDESELITLLTNMRRIEFLMEKLQ